jgi:DIS3-like exonuclease 1
MIENGINLERQFSSSCMAHLPAKEGDWKVTEKDEKERRDLRSRLVMSIDPPGCEDIDDALSLYELPERWRGRKALEIGVHIADVTHFVPHDSLLDREARERGTTVYLADRRMDMLPFILSGQLCSLREQQDRFAMSVLWTLDAETFEVLEVWYGKSIIFSSHEFSYQTAHAILNDALPEKERSKLAEKTNREGEYETVRRTLNQMMVIARQYRKARELKGALELHSTEVKFEMTEQKNPSAIKTKQSLEVMKMVEEFMILANQSVAERIFRAFPTASLLRRHPIPREADFQSLLKAASSMGFAMNVESNK